MLLLSLSILALAAILDIYTVARLFDCETSPTADARHARAIDAMRRTPRPPYDLFGEIPVTWPEVWDWLETVPRISRHSWRARYYLACWNVPDKIRAAKRAGTFDAIIERAP